MSVNQRDHELGLRRAFRFGRLSREEYDLALVERNATWRALTPTQQLVLLDRRLGVGKGAVRQRAKLADLVHLHNSSVCDIVPPIPTTPERKKRMKRGKHGRTD